ncbi:aspartic peptidase domain-containing protein [Suillus spraguei]|nr:aspartic peptidase domain-containing protein [Suillus spraguei]
MWTTTLSSATWAMTFWQGAELMMRARISMEMNLSTSFISGRQVEVLYGPESTGTGDIFLDTITLGGEDGILGIGPENLTRGTAPNDPGDTIPSFTDLQKQISQHVVDSEFGGITFGGTDNTIPSTLVTSPITTMPPSSRYWDINQRITYGSRTIFGLTSGTVDTDTTFLMFASDCFEMYKAATGGTYDQATVLFRITTNQYNALQDLDFHIEGQVFSLTPNAQIWPCFLNTEITNGVAGNIYLIVHCSGTHWGQGDDFTIGYTFIQRFYTVLNGSRSSVGFAATPFTRATTN